VGSRLQCPVIVAEDTHWRGSLGSSTMNAVMKRGPFLAVIFLAVAASGRGAAGMAMFHDGLSARACPAGEALLANRARHLSTPAMHYVTTSHAQPAIRATHERHFTVDGFISGRPPILPITVGVPA